MARVRDRARGIPIVAFSIFDDEQTEQAFAAICRENGILFVTGIMDAVDSAAAAGARVDFQPRDWHWNRTGHEIAGRALAERLTAVAVLKRRAR